MSDALIKYQCPACGAPLGFNPQMQMLHCESCESTFPEDYFKNQQPVGDGADTLPPTKIDWKLEGFVKENQSTEAQMGFSCQSCGAEVLSGDTVATECMYCGNPVVVSNNITGALTPDLILPFKIDKGRAEQLLKEFYNGKPLLPSSFKANNHISKVTGLYVPFWLFSCTGQGNVKFNATKVDRWSDDDYDYTRTEYYSVFRAGSVGFNRIPVDSSKKMDDKYMEGIEPFDFNQLVQFEPMYMAGYFADKFDENVDESTERATKRVIASVEDSFRSTIDRSYDTVNVNESYVQMHGEDIDYALIPVWMLNTKYKGEIYQFAINGQTGQIAGRLPIDTGKLWLYRCLIAVGSFIPLYLIISMFLG